MRIARTDDGMAVANPDTGWVPLADLGITAPDIAEVVAQDDAIRRALEGLTAGGGRAVDDAALRCPVVRPSKVLAIGLNYADHIRETKSAAPERPMVFAKYPNSLNDPFGDVVMDPALTEEGDYEVELAVIIGRRARKVTPATALDHVYGYTVANDVSARDWQRRDSQISRSKSFDTFCPMGPWITTADEVPNPQALGLRSWVNGEQRQNSSTKEMVHGVTELIEFIARGMTLEPGDVILTGTPHGVGFAMDPPKYLVPGDVVRCEVDGLGTISNRVVDPDAG
jgi:2-keto-4-pentenoate hydratase/2-oxohepta-3-ene-1,7-dioic acid hydratase in catechol pathway